MEYPQVNQAAETLIGAIRETEMYQAYQSLREHVMASDESRALLHIYTQTQSRLQMAALAGIEPRQEDTEAFEKLSGLLYADDLLTEYLLTQMKVQKMVAELWERITNDVGLDVPLS